MLEGGAMRGMYTAGVLDVLMQNNIVFDAVIGVSAGALFGINYLSNQVGRVFRYNKKYLHDKRYMGFYSLITSGNIMNKEFCFNELVYNLDKFDFVKFRNSPIDFYATVTNIDTGFAEYIKIDDVESGMEYLRASGSMPLVSKIVEINGKKYLDGGIADSIPAKKAYDLGYDKVVVVLTRPKNYIKSKSFMLPYRICYRKYPKLVSAIEKRYMHYNDSINYIKNKEASKDIFVIRPTMDKKVKRLEKDLKKIESIYNLGILDTTNKLNDLRLYLG